jgi:hypothetical protein
MKGNVVIRNSQVMFLERRVPVFTEGMTIILRMEGNCVATTHT